MIRFVLFAAPLLAATLAATLAAPLAAAEAPAPLRPAVDLTGVEPEVQGRACFGPGGRIVPCRRAGWVR